MNKTGIERFIDTVPLDFVVMEFVVVSLVLAVVMWLPDIVKSIKNYKL